jgi:hypothetical protein
MDKNMLENTVLALLKAAPGLGSIHLNKGLLIIDAYYYSLFHRTLTGINYVKYQYGPVPESDAHAVIYEMGFNKVDVKEELIGHYRKDSHYALVEPDYSVFPSEAVDIINEVAEMIKPMSAKSLSEYTHNEVWENTKKGDIIPIQSAYSIEIVEDHVQKLNEDEEAEFDDALEELYAANNIEIPALCI